MSDTTLCGIPDGFREDPEHTVRSPSFDRDVPALHLFLQGFFFPFEKEGDILLYRPTFPFIFFCVDFMQCIGIYMSVFHLNFLFTSSGIKFSEFMLGLIISHTHSTCDRLVSKVKPLFIFLYIHIKKYFSWWYQYCWRLFNQVWKIHNIDKLSCKRYGTLAVTRSKSTS